MVEIDGSELPARKAEFLKIVYQMGGVAHTNDLAATLGVSPSTATKAAAALTSAGYLEHTPYRGFTLTKSGEEYARFLVRRHRIVSLALSRFGLSSEEACLEASKIESCVSRELVDRICASLGHPMMSGCGPIEHDHSCFPEEL
ncbi:metal-dependent transcriptional regulator [Methanofollis aquaemaris]|uniref:Metal-dependent transcriptional regulator n=1 Tax=Methanofollis aquaemaris TaxID=126734 RepID=A0A8A3S5Q0_9EURY|nr:metal-dependent transcriptional regulator [Methanofollis aquaemaris]QSZ67468.1 metal-dependent transcriptional regulator [Methanofollis aquaemaris]